MGACQSSHDVVQTPPPPYSNVATVPDIPITKKIELNERCSSSDVASVGRRIFATWLEPECIGIRVWAKYFTVDQLNQAIIRAHTLGQMEIAAILPEGHRQNISDEYHIILFQRTTQQTLDPSVGYC